MTDETGMVAELLGLDPMAATPSEYAKSYPHAFKVWINRQTQEPMQWCSSCSASADASWHIESPESVVPDK